MSGNVRSIHDLPWLADIDGDREANAAFIAHAREDVPALVAEVRRLRTENAALRK